MNKFNRIMYNLVRLPEVQWSDDLRINFLPFIVGMTIAWIGVLGDVPYFVYEKWFWTGTIIALCLFAYYRWIIDEVEIYG